MLLIFVLLILLFIITLLVVYVVGLPEEQQERFRSNPFLRLFISAAKAAPETEPAPPLALADHTETAPEQVREPLAVESWSIRQILGIALTGALIVAQAWEVPQILRAGDSSAYRALIFLPFWGAAAGAIGLRAAKLSWRQTVLAAVLAGAALLVIAGFLSMWSPERLWPLFRSMTWLSSGVFLLPLFDPAVRKAGPAPSSGKIAAIALALSASFPFLWAASNDMWKGLFLVNLMPGIPLVPSSILLVSGLIVALFTPRSVAGSWLGGVGNLFSYCIYFGRFALIFLYPPRF